MRSGHSIRGVKVKAIPLPPTLSPLTSKTLEVVESTRETSIVSHEKAKGITY